jgi:hypothetical protein
MVPACVEWRKGDSWVWFLPSVVFAVKVREPESKMFAAAGTISPMKPYNSVEAPPMEMHYSSAFFRQPQFGWRNRLISARRFWEPRRAIYNLVLTVVVAFWVLFTWPHFRPAINLDVLLLLFVLAVLANIC